MAKTLKKAELQSLLHEVQGALSDALLAEKEKLSKANPGEETTAEVPADESATDSSKDSAPEASASGSAPAEGSAPAPAAESAPADSAPPADASAPAADASAPADASAGDPAADASADPQALQAEYAKLGQTDPEALKNHYLACKAALFAMMGAGADPSAPAPAPAAGAPAPAASASPAPDAPPAMKAEMKSHAEANGGKELPIKKSEDDSIALLNEQLNKQNDQLAKHEGTIASLLKVVETICETPVRKAITNISELDSNKSTGKDVSKMSKTEIKAQLKRVAETALNKSDRELINQFDVGRIGAEQIAHLLK